MTTKHDEATGKCLCGAIRFTASGIETHIHSCHCGMCRRWSGGPLLAAAVDAVTFEGEDKVVRYQSSDWAERGFCQACGTNLFYFFKSANKYIMCTGAFDDGDLFTLVGEIYIDSKPKGYSFAGDHERITEKEFLARLQIG